jgi:hypothetical protein
MVTVAQPLVFRADCSYPVTGVLTYHEQTDGSVPSLFYTIDFGVGNCCTVMVTVGSRLEEVNLCTAG